MFHARADSEGVVHFEKLKKIAVQKVLEWCPSKVKTEQIIVFIRNRESAFLKKGVFFDGELQSSVRISQRSSRSENFCFHCCATPKIITSMPLYETYWVKVDSKLVEESLLC